MFVTRACSLGAAPRAWALLLLGCGAGEAPPPKPTEREQESLDDALSDDARKSCEQACERLFDCVSPTAARACDDDCEELLASSRGAPALRYAACLDGKECAQVAKTLGMVVGPIGECYVQAKRMGR